MLPIDASILWEDNCDVKHDPRRSLIEANDRILLARRGRTYSNGRQCSGSLSNPINHVIVIDQENRSVDNLFGSNSPDNQF